MRQIGPHYKNLDLSNLQVMSINVVEYTFLRSAKKLWRNFSFRSVTRVWYDFECL